MSPRRIFHEGTPQLVDHLLASPALARTLASAHIMNDGLQDEWSAALKGERTAGSFHAPVVAVLDFTHPA